MLKVGLRATQCLCVTHGETAAAVGSGLLPVFATPAMIALMEKTACESVAPGLEAGQTTVGIAIDARHLAATPEGLQVRCESTLTAIDRRRLVFELSAFDEAGLIGTARHERFIVDADAFLAKAELRKRR